MKQKVIGLFLLSALAVSVANAQTMRASIRQGSAPNRLVVTIQPNFNFNSQLNEMGFVIMTPKQRAGGIPVDIPTVSIRTTCATCLNTTFPAASWVQIQDIASNADWYLIKLGCVSNLGTAPVLSISNGGIQDVVELEFQNSTVTPVDVRLAHIGDGGPGTQYGFNITDGTSTDRTNYVHMFFGPGLTPAAPLADELIGYATTQFKTLAGVTLPVNWLSFEAVKQGNDGYLTWQVSNEENNHKYEIQRSQNGTDYTTIATVNRNGSGSGVRNYNYTDPNIVGLGATVLYYRIKQFDVDGRTSFSPIRQLKLNIRKGEISVFPNPVKGDGFYVNIPFETPTSKEVKLSLFTSTGQLIRTKQITELQSTNYYFDIKAMNLAAGQYQLQITHDGQVLENKKLMVSKN